MNMICDPDYINQKILECLNYKEFLASEQAKTFTYAASYEEFMKMIELCQDVEYLKLLRWEGLNIWFIDCMILIGITSYPRSCKLLLFKIWRELKDWTLVSFACFWCEIVDPHIFYPDKETSPKGTTKGDLLKARNLKRYLNQVIIHCNFVIRLIFSAIIFFTVVHYKELLREAD